MQAMRQLYTHPSVPGSETLVIDPDQADALASLGWEPMAPTGTVEELRQQAVDLGVDVPEHAKKADIVDLITAAATTPVEETT